MAPPQSRSFVLSTSWVAIDSYDIVNRNPWLQKHGLKVSLPVLNSLFANNGLLNDSGESLSSTSKLGYFLLVNYLTTLCVHPFEMIETLQQVQSVATFELLTTSKPPRLLHSNGSDISAKNAAAHSGSPVGTSFPAETDFPPALSLGFSESDIYKNAWGSDSKANLLAGTQTSEPVDQINSTLELEFVNSDDSPRAYLAPSAANDLHQRAASGDSVTQFSSVSMAASRSRISNLAVAPILFADGVFQPLKQLLTSTPGSGWFAAYKGHFCATFYRAFVTLVQPICEQIVCDTFDILEDLNPLAYIASWSLVSYVASPLELLQTRLVCQGKPAVYHGTFHGLLYIFKHENGFHGWYPLRLMLPSLASYALTAFIRVNCHLVLGSALHGLVNMRPLVSVLISVTSALVEAAVVLPIDVCRKRMQLSPTVASRSDQTRYISVVPTAAKQYNGFWNCFFDTLLTEGGALYRKKQRRTRRLLVPRLSLRPVPSASSRALSLESLPVSLSGFYPSQETSSVISYPVGRPQLKEHSPDSGSPYIADSRGRPGPEKHGYSSIHLLYGIQFMYKGFWARVCNSLLAHIIRDLDISRLEDASD